MHACRTPARASLSTSAEASAVLRLVSSMPGNLDASNLDAQALERVLLELDAQTECSASSGGDAAAGRASPRSVREAAFASTRSFARRGSDCRATATRSTSASIPTLRFKVAEPGVGRALPCAATPGGAPAGQV